VIIQRRELMAATRQAVMGQGLPPEAPWVVFDYPLFLVDSDLAPIGEKIGEIIGALTSWQPANNRTGVFNKPQWKSPAAVTRMRSQGPIISS